MRLLNLAVLRILVLSGLVVLPRTEAHAQDRWRHLFTNGASSYDLDMKRQEALVEGVFRVWARKINQAPFGAHSTSPTGKRLSFEEILHLDVDCKTLRFRMLRMTRRMMIDGEYPSDSLGKRLPPNEWQPDGQPTWHSPEPETDGESLVDRTCALLRP